MEVLNSTQNDISYSTINVEFHNKSQQRGYNLRDDFNYSMACLNSQGALFAVESRKDNPSVLFFKPQNTWAIKSVTFPKDEDITGTTKMILISFNVCCYIINQ